MKILICLGVVLSLTSCVSPKAFNPEKEGDEEVEEIKPAKKLKSGRLSKTISASDIEVRLDSTDGSTSRGLAQVVLPPRLGGSLPLCFPQDHEDVAGVFRLAHAVCRQLGLATASELLERRSSEPREGVRADSARCVGDERAVTQCDWSGVRQERCQKVTEIACGNCRKTFTEMEGLIRTPGYPVAFLYHLSCEWKVEVPEGNFIHLVFDQLNAPPLEQSAFECASDKPFIELTYGTQGHFSIYRYCNFKDIESLSVPSNHVKIHYSSGTYDPRIIHVQDKRQGLAISFRAEPEITVTSLWWLIPLTVAIIVVIGVVVIVYYCRLALRKNLRVGPLDHHQGTTAPNVPGFSDLERAYDFQRCYIQGKHDSKPGLRLRSTGSGKSKLSSMMYPITAVSETFRKLSSKGGGTPLNTLPHTGGGKCMHPQMLMISHCKTNLADRYSSSRNNSDTSVFLEPTDAPPGFTIYQSESSDPRETSVIIPRETAL